MFVVMVRTVFIVNATLTMVANGKKVKSWLGFFEICDKMIKDPVLINAKIAASPAIVQIENGSSHAIFCNQF